MPNLRRRPGHTVAPGGGNDPSPPSESGRLPLPEELGLDPPASGRVGQLEVFTDGDFPQRVLQSDRPVVVDFWAPTCIPCRLQEPTIRRLAGELEGQVTVGRLDVFGNPDVPERLRIKGVPHLVVFKGGQPVLELVGDHSLEQLLERLAVVL